MAPGPEILFDQGTQGRGHHLAILARALVGCVRKVGDPARVGPPGEEIAHGRVGHAGRHGPAGCSFMEGH